MEAKPLPDFSATDDYQVSLKFKTEIRDVPFLVYIRQEQQKRPKHHKLNVFQLIAIYNVCFGDGLEVKQKVVNGLVEEGLLLRAKSGKVSMTKGYKKLVSEIGHNDRANDSRNDSVRKTYDTIKANPGIQRKGISDITGKSIPTIDRHISQLVKEDLIEHRDADKNGGYYGK